MSRKRIAPVAGLLPGLLLAVFAAAPARAAESYDNCSHFITSIPATITSQGVWCMNADLSASLASGDAITVSVNNVTIDCNGFKLGNLAAGPANSAIGIAAAGRLNTTVRGCNLRGFYVAGLLSGGGHLIENNRIEASGYVGLWLTGDASMIRGNRVVDTGNEVYGAFAGILTSGIVDVSDNVVIGVAALPGSNGNVTGISVGAAMGGRVEHNAIRSLLPDGTGLGYGIFINNDSGGLGLSGNRINSGSADLPGSGIQCAGAATSYLVDNQAIGFASDLSSCTSIGLNFSD